MALSGVFTDDESGVAAWQSFTPTLTNITLGNGTITTRFQKVGNTAFYRGEYIAGSTSSVGGSISISLPLTAVATAGYEQTVAPIGDVVVFNSGVTQYLAIAYMASTTSMSLQIVNASGTNATVVNPVNATVPFTWSGANGGIIWNVYYEVA